MASEIEHKFLLKNDAWRDEVLREAYYQQAYFSSSEQCSIRVRISGDKAYLNLKSATLGIVRDEYDYEIPIIDAKEMLEKLTLGSIITKTRYFVERSGHTWEIDVFEGDNAGLVVAEIELSQVDEVFDIPDWIGDNVSDDPRYYNVCLVSHPYKDWSSD